jgi:hypothetical protein
MAWSAGTERGLLHNWGRRFDSSADQNDKAAKRRLHQMIALPKQKNPGAGEGARTLDPDLGKVVLYH